MTPAQKSRPLEVFSGDLRALETDLLVVPVFEGEISEHEQWSHAIGGELARAGESKEFTGKLYEIFVTPIADRVYQARRLAALGVGPAADFNTDRARRAAAALGLEGRRRKIARIGFVARGRFESPEVLQAVAEGLTLAEFDGASYKTVNHEPFEAQGVAIVVQEVSAAVGAAVGRGRVLGECSNLARQLANEPANRLTPSMFAERAAALARDGGLLSEVLDDRRLAALGMGLLLGVGQGSIEPPRLVALRYEPAGAPAHPVLGLVGKGITFDTGGISIKPAEGMDRMKDDMAGGAAVIGAMCAIARLKAPIKVVGVVPIAENMPSGRAFRPGDVLTSASGKTVEVLNTDAEGRLVLGDGLWYARQQMGATHLVDIATLTSSVVRALGKITSGLYGTPPSWVEIVRGVAERAGDRCWPMPLFEEYRDQLKSEIADMVNIGGLPAGSITAALFLKEFTGDLPWAHIDIAGTAWNEEARPYLPKGATGVGVRTLAELAFTSSSWPG
ncbi:MAG TPA: leucyl aminopeptidase [Vicinamibacterales bacterium]|jgi:leucyl aminopeptidase|nr:leucyl aminopeptidase [Vicinamibacterales bacterium]